MTKYVSTMSPEEIERWMRAPGAAAAGKQGRALLDEIESLPKTRAPRPPKTKLCACGATIRATSTQCRTCAAEVRRKAPFTPATELPADFVVSQQVEPPGGLAPDHKPLTVELQTPCRFCGAPAVVEDRCQRHDELWQRLHGKPATELQAIAERRPA